MNNTISLDRLAIIANQKIKERDYWTRKFTERVAPAAHDVTKRYSSQKKSSQKNKILAHSNTDWPRTSAFPTGSGQKAAAGQEDAPAAGAAVQSVLEPRLWDRIMAVGGQSDHTLHVILTAGLSALLSRYTGMENLLIATPIYKQEEAGEYINTVLPLCIDMQQGITFKDLLLQVKEVLKEAAEHQAYPVQYLLNKLEQGDKSSTAADRRLETALLLGSIQAEGDIRPARPALLFACDRKDNELHINLHYDPMLYTIENSRQILQHFERLLNAALKDVDRELDSLEILSPEEKEELLYTYNDTAADYPGDKTLQNLFSEQVQKKGEHPAVAGAKGGDTLTYKQLDEQARELAEQMQKKGVQPGDIVALIMPRSIAAVAAIMAVLKAGAAFLPVDPETPKERIDFILKDSAAKVYITEEGIETPRRGEPIKEMGTGREINKSFDRTFSKVRPPGGPPEAKSETGTDSQHAYIIYTSGSTGRPKGVVISHRSAVNYIWWAIKQYVGDEQVDFPLFTSLSFDLTITSVFTPLLSGNSVVVYPGSGKESLIEEVLKDDLAGVIKLTPAHLKLILASNLGRDQESGKIRSRVKRLILGGEALETKLARDIIERFENPPEIYNEYGPTEATVGCMIHRFDPEKDTRRTVPIGVPADNVQIYLLDNKQRPVPTGVPGEMYIAGDGLACCYLNRPKLTEEKFIASGGPPFCKKVGPKTFPEGPAGHLERTANHTYSDPSEFPSQGGVPRRGGVGSSPTSNVQLIYRTGDLARHLGSGNIEFIGRMDHQVKIRGFRVELGEIEATLKNYRKNKSILAGDLNVTEKLKAARRCTRCLLPGNFPGIKFDDRGVCSVCTEFDGYKDRVDDYFKKPEDFVSLLEKIKPRNKGDYDCLLLFSGGKDSTYVLYKLIDMGLKVLTFTFDNGFISDAAFANIKKTTAELGVDNIVGQAKDINKVFVESLSINRSVCHGCWNALNSLGTQTAHERGINLVISGLSRGQIFEMRLEALFGQGIFDEKEVAENLLIFRKTFHSRSSKYSRILDIEIPGNVVEQVHFVDFFRYNDSSVPDIREYLLGKGWVQPKDTGFCSSNCLINDVGIYVFIKELGYHFYAAQMSWDCRLGVISREQGLKEIGFKSNVGEVDRILKDIGYYRPPIVDAVVIDAEKENGETHLIAYIVTEEDITVSELRSYLSGSLPDYMIPANFIKIEKIPITPAGKVDRKALSANEQARLETGTDYVAPSTHTEQLIAASWKESLGLDDVGVNDNFFELGGTSFDIVNINNHLQSELKKNIPVANMFNYPTIRSLAEHLSGTGESEITAEQEQEMTEKMDRGKNRLKERTRRRRKWGAAHEPGRTE